ncbi:hypothetical protein NNC19_12590 [Clostridium sp. SHJSY1]|uniref:hypothetical protein n=1 Tax=Clostridium sp. SHJSY1 TaxID=2942483 RepID=UPI002875FF24|nr:hypothetical protein [Clostridium sp. SHJSY1]MDS0526521.1 hypothetical protein [Clostridium sp. SHJSY1]
MSIKKVLYIGTPMYTYYKKIISEFKAQGYEVDFYNDRPSENSFIKGIIKIKKDMINFLIEKYFEDIINEIKDKEYNLVFVVDCKVFTAQMIRYMKSIQKKAKFVLHMWDSLELYPNSKEVINEFDMAYSFDLKDCEEVESLKFLPLFYCKEFENIGLAKQHNCIYDIASVCTAHPNRYKTMKILFPKLESQGVNVYSYMYLNKLQYLYNRAFITEFKGAKRDEFKFMPLSEKENLDILRNTNTVFDMPHNKQSGLTMRTIETLGAKRKLITTNTDIKKYDFYNENNILIIENDNLDGITDFIKREYREIKEPIYRKYSISSYVNTIIDDANYKYLKVI